MTPQEESLLAKALAIVRDNECYKAYREIIKPESGWQIIGAFAERDRIYVCLHKEDVLSAMGTSFSVSTLHEQPCVDLRNLTARLQDEIEALKAIKFHRFNEQECWIYQGDGQDHLESLVCPVVIDPKRLLELEKAEMLLAAFRELLHEQATKVAAASAAQAGQPG